MRNVTLFAAFGDQVVRGTGSAQVKLAMGESVRLLSSGDFGEIIRPPRIRFPTKVSPVLTNFDVAARVYRVEDPPSQPAESEEAIVVEAPTSGELGVGELDEVVELADTRDSDLVVLLKRRG
jgi:hypothetical protein